MLQSSNICVVSSATETPSGGKSRLKSLRPRNINRSLLGIYEAALRLLELLEGRAFLSLVLVFSQVAYGMPQHAAGQALSQAAAASSSAQSADTAQTPA